MKRGWTATPWRAAFEDLQETLATAQQDRHRRQEWVEEPDGREIGWVVYERQVMTDRVNLLRSREGLPPIPMADVAAKEHMAQGHIDYTRKWALYCADLVVPSEMRQSPAGGESDG
jgi:hypothetical protein